MEGFIIKKTGISATIVADRYLKQKAGYKKLLDETYQVLILFNPLINKLDIIHHKLNGYMKFIGKANLKSQ